MAVGRNGFIRAIPRFPAFQLVQVLADQITFDAVTGDKRQGFLHDFQLAQTRELVQHGQHLVFVVDFRPPVFKIHLVGRQTDNHIDQNPNQRPQPRLIVGLGNDVQADRIFVVHQILDFEIGTTDIGGDHIVAVQSEKRFSCGKNRSGLLFRSVQHILSGRRDDRQRTAVGMGIRRHFHP